MKEHAQRKNRWLAITLLITLLVIIFPLKSQANGVTIPTPISQYQFDETTGATTISDTIRGASGQGNVYGNPTFETGKVGNSMCLNGSSQYATAPLIGSGLNEFTVSAWVKLDQRTSWATIVKNWGETPGAFHFGLDGPGQYWSNFIGTVNPSGAPNVSSSSAGLATTGSWQYVVTTVSQSQGKMYLYLNGTQVAEQNFSGTITASGALMSFGLKLNNQQTGPSTDGNPGWLDGCLDEITFWNVALSSAQLNAIVQGGGGVTTHTVTFAPNGGQESSYTQTESSASNLTANSFTRSGFRFTGWATSQSNADAGITTYADTENYSFGNSITLYAVWAPNSPSPTPSPNNTSETHELAQTGNSPTIFISFVLFLVGLGFILRKIAGALSHNGKK